MHEYSYFYQKLDDSLIENTLSAKFIKIKNNHNF
jgi:hypothetical protein